MLYLWADAISISLLYIRLAIDWNWSLFPYFWDYIFVIKCKPCEIHTKPIAYKISFLCRYSKLWVTYIKSVSRQCWLCVLLSWFPHVLYLWADAISISLLYIRLAIDWNWSLFPYFWDYIFVIKCKPCEIHTKPIAYKISFLCRYSKLWVTYIKSVSRQCWLCVLLSWCPHVLYLWADAISISLL